jgi:RNA polymerase sigma-70 factor (ECF subfamily)
LNLINNIKNGTEKAFTEVYQQYHVKLYRYFLKKTKSDEMATELVQITFVKLWRFKHTLSENLTLDTQIFNIARTSLIDLIRQKNIRNNRFISLESNMDKYLYNHSNSAFELTDYFNNAIKSLPPVRKKVFILSRLQGLSYKEIARQLSISVHTVEDHIGKAIRHIKSFGSFLFGFLPLLFIISGSIK